jgi:hypothetical protein
MKTNDKTAEKRTAVEYLSFGAKTAKRVTWEAWEFTVVGPHLVEVTNASYGFEKDDHSYTVGVKERDGLAIPAECNCPADIHREKYDCKHKVALAAVGGKTVLEASMNFATPSESSKRPNASTVADKLRTDGGITTKETGGEAKHLDASEHNECDCAGLSEDFPCWPCVRDGKRELPE